MSKQNQVAEAKSDNKNRPKVEPAVAPAQAYEPAALTELPIGPIGAAGDGTIDAQAVRLGDPRFQTIQRQAMAAQIGQVQGNQHLQRLMASLNQGNEASRAPIQRDNGYEASGVATKKGVHTTSLANGRRADAVEATDVEIIEEGLGGSGPPTLATAEPPPNGKGANGKGNKYLIQRQEAAPVTKTANQLIEDHTSLWMLDEAGLAKDLVALLPAQSPLVEQVLNTVAGHNQDDVAYEIVLAMPGELKKIPDHLRVTMINKMVYGVVTGDEEGAIADIWKSFEPGIADVAEKNRELWKKSLWESDQLVEHVKPIGDSFAADVVGLAKSYLTENKRVLYAEAQRYGIDLEHKQSVEPTHPNYLQSVRPIAQGVLQLKKKLDELKQISVGYNTQYDPETGADVGDYPAMFDPEIKPDKPPKNTESPPWPTWEEVKTQYDRVSAVISAFANMYPTIYLLLQQDKLEALDQVGDAAKAEQVIRETLEKTEEKIQEADGKITSGKITHYDLKLIQTQLFSGAGKDVYAPHYPWDQPYYQDIANDDIKGHEARQFWVDLGLSLTAAAAIIAAPFTGGATAAFLVGFGLGIGGAQAGMSWDKYLSLSTLSDAKTKDELALVAQGEVSAQLVDAIIQTVAVFLDAYGAKAATTAARASREAVELAEKGLKEQLVEETRRRMMREAGKDIGITAAGAGAAIGMHELAEDEPVPDMEAIAKQWQINLGSDQPNTTPAGINRMLIQRTPGPGGPPPGTAAKEPILLTGGEFEIYVEKALLKGEMGGLPPMSFVIPGQYTGSGWGIDRIGIVFDESTGIIDVYHLEMKFVAPGSPHVPALGRPAVGTQTGGAWTQKAVDGFLNSQHPVARTGKERLRRALQKMHPGEFIDIERMRSFLHGRLVGAPVLVVVPHWADFSRLYKQVAALVRAGRDIRIVKAFKP
jgi:hypothetical protein